MFGDMEQQKQAASGLFSMLGHKADLMIVHFRKTLDELNQAELTVARSELNEFLEPTSSYVSVVELGLYEASVKAYCGVDGAGTQTGNRRMEPSSRNRIGQTA